MKRELAIETIAFLFIVLFLYAAGSKLSDYNMFVGQIGKSPMLTNYAESLAWIIPVLEITIAVILMIPRTKLLGLYSAFGLMVIFTLYIGVILSFSKDLPCSCGGVLSKLGWTEHLIFNIGFVLLGVVGIMLHASKKEDRAPVTA